MLPNEEVNVGDVKLPLPRLDIMAGPSALSALPRREAGLRLDLPPMLRCRERRGSVSVADTMPRREDGGNLEGGRFCEEPSVNQLPDPAESAGSFPSPGASGEAKASECVAWVGCWAAAELPRFRLAVETTPCSDRDRFGDAARAKMSTTFALDVALTTKCF